MFFVWGNPDHRSWSPWSWRSLVYFLEIFIDNNFARVKWQAMLKGAWIVALVFGGVNIAVLAFI